MIRVIHDTCSYTNITIEAHDGSNDPRVSVEEAIRFFWLLKDAEVKLYSTSAKLSKLSFDIKLLHLKYFYNLSDAIDDLLKPFKETLPTNILIPDSYYETKKIVRNLSLDYIKIDTCKNNCILYWREHGSS